MIGPHSSSGKLADVFFANRLKLLAFLASRGASDEAEDVLHELWLRAAMMRVPDADIHTPLAYLYRMANMLIIDRYRQRRQTWLREEQWHECHDLTLDSLSGSPSLSPEREIAGRQTAALILAVIDAQGARAARIFRQHRIDGMTQREVANEMGVSIGTVEGDLRKVYRALHLFRIENE